MLIKICLISTKIHQNFTRISQNCSDFAKVKNSHGRRCRAVEQRREILKLSRNFARAQYAVFLACATALGRKRPLSVTTRCREKRYRTCVEKIRPTDPLKKGGRILSTIDRS